MEYKRIYNFYYICLEILYLLLGIIFFIISKFEYTFIPSDVLFYLFTSILIVLFSIIKFKYRKVKSKIFSAVSAFLPLLVILFLVNYYNSSETETNAIFIYIIFNSIIIFFFCSSGKILHGILYLILIVFICIILLLIFILDDSKINIIVLSEYSPNLKYLAEIIYNDQDALDGNTYVKIYEQNMDKDVLFGKLIKNPKVIYKGEGIESFSMIIYWESDDVLYINGVKNNINK